MQPAEWAHALLLLSIHHRYVYTSAESSFNWWQCASSSCVIYRYSTVLTGVWWSSSQPQGAGTRSPSRHRIPEWYNHPPRTLLWADRHRTKRKECCLSSQYYSATEFYTSIRHHFNGMAVLQCYNCIRFLKLWQAFRTSLNDAGSK